MFYKRIIIGWIGVFLSLGAARADVKGLDRVVSPSLKSKPVLLNNHRGLTHTLYQQSHALLIGVSDYTRGWPDLTSVPRELEEVKQVLSMLGFSITELRNPTDKTLREGFVSFIKKHGFNRNNRLLIFYSGHGYTRLDGDKGYLVPANAIDPKQDEAGFLQTALPMTQILAWSREIEAKHVLFLFDSCFSGTVFKTRALPKVPRYISQLAALPVRQYISAGSAGEEVPAKSVFTPMFVDALRYGTGDLNKDGYITGSELGMYLQSEVPNHVRQTPQYGKINDYDLSRGDFVFQTLELPDKPTLQTPSKGKPVQLAQVAPVFNNPHNSVVTQIQNPKPRHTRPFYMGAGVVTLDRVRVGSTRKNPSVTGKYADQQTAVPLSMGYEYRTGLFKLGGELSLILSSKVWGLKAQAMVHRYFGKSLSLYAYTGLYGFSAQQQSVEFYKSYGEPCGHEDGCDHSVFPAAGAGLQFYLQRYSVRAEYYLGTVSNGWMGSVLMYF